MILPLVALLSASLFQDPPPPGTTLPWSLTQGEPSGRAVVGRFTPYSGRGVVLQAGDDLALCMAPSVHNFTTWVNPVGPGSTPLQPSTFTVLPADPDVDRDGILVSHPTGLSLFVFDEDDVSSDPNENSEFLAPPFDRTEIVVAGIPSADLALALDVCARDYDGDGVAEIALLDAERRVRLIKKIAGTWEQVALIPVAHNPAATNVRWDVELLQWNSIPEQLEVAVSGSWGTEVFNLDPANNNPRQWYRSAPPTLPHAMAVVPPAYVVSGPPFSEAESLAVVQGNTNGTNQRLTLFWNGGNGTAVVLGETNIVGLGAGLFFGSEHADLALEYANAPDHPGRVRVLRNQAGLFSVDPVGPGVAPNFVDYAVRSEPTGEVHAFSFADLNGDDGADLFSAFPEALEITWVRAFPAPSTLPRALSEPLEVEGYHLWAPARNRGAEYGAATWELNKAGIELEFINLWGSSFTTQHTHIELTLWGPETYQLTGVSRVALLHAVYEIDPEAIDDFRGSTSFPLRLGFSLPDDPLTSGNPDDLSHFTAEKERYYVELRAVRYANGNITLPLTSYCAGMTYFHGDATGDPVPFLLNNPGVPPTVLMPPLFKHYVVDQTAADESFFYSRDDVGGFVPQPRIPPKQPPKILPAYPELRIGVMPFPF